MTSAMTLSVCMACYNGAAYLKPQLDSILSALPRDSELIVADDGSTDGSRQILESYQDSRLRLLPSETASPLGVVANIERALMASQGQILMLGRPR